MKLREFVMIVLFALSINTLSLYGANVQYVDSSDIENAGILEKGDGVSLIPAKGYALSVTRLIKGKEGPASYDITLKSGGRVLYDQRNEKEDIYFVFNDEVEPGDIIDIFVHDGRFKYTITKIDELPNVVLDALKKKSLKKSEQAAPQERVSAAVPAKRAPLQQTLKKSSPKPKARKKKHGLLYGIKRALREAADVLTGKDRKKRPKKVSPKRSVEEVLGEPVLPSKSVKKTAPSLPPAPAKTKPAEPISPPKNVKMPAPEISAPSVAAPSVAAPAPSPALAPPAPKLSPVSTSPGMPVSPTPPDLRIQSPEMVARPITAPTFEESAPEIAKETEPTVAPVEPPRPPKERPVEELKRAPQISVPVTTPPAPKPIVQKEPVVSPAKVSKPKQKKTPPQVVEEPIVETPVKRPKPVVQKIEKPTPPPPPIEKKSDKIVITKLIDKEKYEEEPIERMSDRVLGTGYQGENRAKLQVKAYSNGRPVSAWVEVIDAKTKRRVKTFYTSRGQIRLPAGTYLVRATYRTLSAKMRKSLGRVHLKDGGLLKKKVYFNDGTLLVIAKRGGSPLYVKVEVYKAGSKRRVTYDFSSRRTGVAQLKIPAGRYDIVVKEHGFVKRFDNVQVPGNKITSIEALF